MQLFYVPTLQLTDDVVMLSETDAHHAVRVLRLREGTEVLLTNGGGLRATGHLEAAQERFVSVRIEKVQQLPPDPAALCMAVAPTKNHDRFEWFVEKATEIGVHQITPLIAEHAERRTVQRARLERLLVAALKQSQSFFMPVLEQETNFTDLIGQAYRGQKFIAWCGDATALPLPQALQKGQAAQILIGPEGDFSAAEVELALNAGYRPVRLGPKRLRTETAALAACHIFNLINES